METEHPLKLVVVSDRPLVRLGIVQALQAEGCCEVEGKSYNPASSLLIPNPDVVLSVVEPQDDLREWFSVVRTLWPSAKLACLFLGENDDALMAALQAGASAIVDDNLGSLTTWSDLVV